MLHELPEIPFQTLEEVARSLHGDTLLVLVIVSKLDVQAYSCDVSYHSQGLTLLANASLGASITANSAIIVVDKIIEVFVLLFIVIVQSYLLTYL